MRTNASLKTTLALLLVGVCAVASAQTKYWTGGNGAWSDAAHWSLTPGGPGGAGMPHADENVVIAPLASATIEVLGNARCADLQVHGLSGPVQITGPASAQLTIAGGWRMTGQVEWPFAGTTRLVVHGEGVEVDLCGRPIGGQLMLDGDGSWSVTSDLVIAAGDVVLREGDLITNGNLLKAHALRTEGSDEKRLIGGRSVVMLEVVPDLNTLNAIVEPTGATLSVGGTAVPWNGDGAAMEDRDVNVCGTGPGQTPFVVTATLVSNYNGFGVRCRGDCNGTVTVSVTGGSGNFTYSWLFGGPPTQTWTAACGGPQIVIVTDVTQGISCPVQVNVSEPAPLGVIFFGQGTPPTCADVCNGSRTALAVGGVSPYTYNWNNGAGTGSSFFALCAGNNSLVITDANLCTFDTIFFFNLLPIAPNLTFTNTTCFGQCDGTATVAPSGGTPSFSVVWTPTPPIGQGTNNASGLCPGNYTVEVTDANGCDTTVAFTIAEPPPILPNLTFTNASCFGSCDGTATVVPAGAIGPYTYNWVPAPGTGQGTGSVTGLCAGLYTVLITDQSSGCDSLVSVTIDSPGAIDVQGTVTDATCSDVCDGTIVLSVSGGLAPYAFLWAPAPPIGQGTGSVSGLCPGNWSVTVTDASGCDTTLTFTISAPPPLDPTLATTDVSCAGACDGTATVTVTGGVAPYGFVWTPAPGSGQGTDTVTDLCAGNYSLTVTDANGCDTTLTFEILEPPPLVAVPSQTNVTCGTLCDGTASVVVSGGTPTYDYVWTPAPPAGQGTPDASGLCAGAYSVLITDANGCTLTVPFTITDPAPILLSLQVLPATCPDVCDGTAGVIVSGGIAPYGYVWAPAPGTGQGSPDVAGLCPQAYTLTVTDAVGCDTTIAFTVPAPPPITVSALVTDATCAGDCDGSIVLTVSGGNGVFSYAWVPAPPVGQGTGSISGLCAGDWQVTIISGACDTTLTFTVIEPPPLDASLTTTDPTCGGDCDGTATVVVSGGTAPYGYNWSPAPPVGQGTSSVSGLCAGNYTLVVSDASGCDTTIAFVINAPVPVSATLVITPASCGGLCDGTATATPSGGTPPYDFLWGPGVIAGQGTPVATALCAGAYTITVTDSLGCDTTILFTLSTPSGIIAVPTVTNASCADICDGAIVLTTGGGLPPYIYTWAPNPPVGQGTPNVSGLCPGAWTVVISDGAACDTVMVFDITSPTPIIPNAISTNESCNGPCDGTASVSPTGGQAPYLYVWTPVPPNGQGGPNATDLCPGVWSVLITDAGGCDTTVVFTILPELPIDAGLVVVNGPCANECGGSASVSPTGGVPPFTFTWNPTPPVGQGTNAVSGLCIGNWQVRVTDAAGCDTTIDFSITTPPPIQPGLITIPETCLGACSGTATVNPIGGNGPIVIDWQPPPAGGQGTTTATGLCAGTNYTVTLTDANACDTTIAFTIAPFTAIVANASSTPTSCPDACDGTATVGPTGGVPPYSYVWSPSPGGGQGTPQATGLCVGVVSVLITDPTGCSITQDILITGPPPIVDDPDVINVACATECTGSIILNPSGGTAPYLFAWTPVPPNGQGTASALNLCAGTWNVVITDANGCTAPFSYTIIEPPALALVTQSTPSQCQVCIGTATVVISGGVTPYDVVWIDAGGATVGTTENIIDLCAGIYIVRVTDANGCVLQQAVPITDTNGEVLTTTDGSTSCPNTCDGAVSVSFTCSDPTCVIAWYDAAGNDLGQSGTSLSGLCPGDYYVTVTNGSGCLTIDTATVVAPPPTVLLISSSPVTCAGACDGTATVGINGGVAPYVIVWDPPPGGGQGTPLATGLCAGVYTVTVSDAGGCDTTASVLIVEPLPLDVTSIVIDIGCSGQCDGNITLAPFGGVAPYTFFWSPVPVNGQGSSAAFGLCAGDFIVTITDANGCSITNTYTIIEPAPLQVSVSTTPSTCPACDGTATTVVTGGTGPYEFSWVVAGVEVDSVQNPVDLCGGLYTLTVVDANFCFVVLQVPLNDSNAEVLTITNGQTSCANDCDGVVSVSFVCTDPPCSTMWVDAGGTVIALNVLSLTDLCVGTYTVIVANGSGCKSIADAVVVPSQTITPNLSTTPVSCAGACDGTATVGPTGGVSPYTYLWDPPPPIGQGTPQAQGLCAGTYTLLITDSVGCDTTIALLIVEPALLLQNAVVQNAACSAVCDGSIVATPNGGTAPYIFFWTPVPPNGQGGNTATDLCAGDYTLRLSDANGCDTTVTYTITEPLPITIAGTTSPSACGVCSGAVSVVVSGGTAPYTYAWTSGGNLFGTNDTLANICAGFYTVLVTDANLCQATLLVPVTDIDGEVTTTSDGLTTCPGDCDGIVSVAFNCGDPTCTIAWFDADGNDLNENGNQLDSLCAGLYLVQVTNGSGCITIDTAYVNEPDAIVPNLSTTPVTCFGACDGTATVGPSGGVPPYDYVWDPVPPIGQGTPQAQGLCAGVWTVVISDSAGCSITVDVLIIEPPLLIADATVTPITCNGACDGVIVVTPQGGVAPYAFNWSPVPNGQGTGTATDLCAGDWNVTVTDANGCDTTITITLVDPPILGTTVTTTDNSCFGDCLGTAVAVITGGVGPFGTVWRDAGGNTIAAGVDSIGGLCAGDYSLEVTDANGCVFTTPFSITEGAAILANLLFTNETCFGPCDGTANVSPSGGVGPYTILWQPDPPTGQGTSTVTGLCAGPWSVTITDSLGCDTTVAFLILPFAPILANANVIDVQCNGACDGSITLVPSGGFGGYIYFWDPVPPNGQGNATATGLCPGDYNVTISDVIGCDSIFTFTITEPLPVLITVDQLIAASCVDAADGTIGTTATGGTPPYTFDWDGPGGFTSALEDLTGLFPGDYTLVVTDSHNCTDTVLVTVDALFTVVADAGPDQNLCFGVAVLLDGSLSMGALTYSWTDDQGTVISTDTTAAPGLLVAGSHTFTLTVTNGPCSSTDQVTITVLDLPLADAGSDHFIVIGEPVTLGASPTGPQGSTFFWAPDTTLNGGSVANPVANPPTTTWYTVLVTAPNGCQDIDSVLVTVIPEVVIPSGFTPNGDGWNETWEIDYIDQFPDCEVEIYNRWGELLFESVGYKQPWDGRYSGGLVPVGTYYYVVKLNDPRFPDAYTGPLTVIR